MNQVAIGSIPGLSFIQNEFAAFILSIIPIHTDRKENFGLFSCSHKILYTFKFIWAEGS